ncbi:hypothetical protein TrLO_g7894 [Triparma laevis f. longispina]|uniref:C2H2-type domain-containing protein n=1 Tax=Triparma laevis f. longispina TaxID=1714387 RepID=A0A9W7L0S1_9STRA|nr:hypothetical protein TrLO_g7894 [Triparma laevis f. longispina]
MSYGDGGYMMSIMTGVTGETWDDDASVASENVEAPLRRAWNRYRRIEGVERVKRGYVTRTRGIAGCQYKTGKMDNMKNHKAAKHGINVVWFSCDQDNCDYKAKQTSNLRHHRQHVHNIDVKWYHCDSCEYKAKRAGGLKEHNIDVVWHHCDLCDYKAKQGSVLKVHKLNVHKVGVVWHQCEFCDHKAKQSSDLKHTKPTRKIIK